MFRSQLNNLCSLVERFQFSSFFIIHLLRLFFLPCTLFSLFFHSLRWYVNVRIIKFQIYIFCVAKMRFIVQSGLNELSVVIETPKSRTRSQTSNSDLSKLGKKAVWSLHQSLSNTETHLFSFKYTISGR